MSHKTLIETIEPVEGYVFTMNYFEWNMKGNVFYSRETCLDDEVVNVEYNYNLEASGWTENFNDLGISFRPQNTNQ